MGAMPDELLGMQVGQILPMTACQVLHGDPKGDFIRVGFKALKGRRFVFLFLGDESVDGRSDPLDCEKRLQELGWARVEVDESPTGWLPIVLCPTDGVERALKLSDGREVTGAFRGGGWVATEKTITYEAPVYAPEGGFIPTLEPQPRPEPKQIGTREQSMRLLTPLPNGVYPTHFRPNDTIVGKPE